VAILWGVQGNSCCCVLKLPHPSAGWGQFCAHWKKCRFPSAAGSDLIGKKCFSLSWCWGVVWRGANSIRFVCSSYRGTFDATVLILFSRGMFCYNTYRGAFEAFWHQGETTTPSYRYWGEKVPQWLHIFDNASNLAGWHVVVQMRKPHLKQYIFQWSWKVAETRAAELFGSTWTSNFSNSKVKK
jgi:hypothetical protein